MDAATIASLATAGGTLVLAVATFGSTRTANKAARVSEQALQAGLRPVLFPARAQDAPQKAGFIDGHFLELHDGLGAVQIVGDNIYLAMPLRNVGNGLAVLHGWHLNPGQPFPADEAPSVEEFRRQGRDLYVPAGDISFWQAAIRDSGDPLHGSLREMIEKRERIAVDLLYGDHEGGQRTISRFALSAPTEGVEDEPWMWVCVVARHWNLDRDDPR